MGGVPASTRRLANFGGRAGKKKMERIDNAECTEPALKLPCRWRMGCAVFHPKFTVRRA
jgi:hypothetical protein